MELHKRLYELTGWRPGAEAEKMHTIVTGDHTVGYGTPDYDTDYLLDKLPATIPSKEHPGYPANLVTRKELQDPDDADKGSVYFAWYTFTGSDPADYGVHADTPNEALLKLSIKLAEEKLI